MKNAGRKIKVNGKSINMESEENETDRSGEIKISPSIDKRQEDDFPSIWA